MTEPTIYEPHAVVSQEAACSMSGSAAEGLKYATAVSYVPYQCMRVPTHLDFGACMGKRVVAELNFPAQC